MPGLEQLTAPPAETAFSEQAHSHDTTLLLVRTLVATAAADGNVDAGQRAQILDGLKAAGLEAGAVQFLEGEIQHPASVDDLVKAVGGSKELGLQVYAAAHLIARSPQEKAFLQSLAQGLALDPALVAHVDATTAPPSRRADRRIAPAGTVGPPSAFNAAAAIGGGEQEFAIWLLQ